MKITASAPQVVEVGEQFRLLFVINAVPSSFEAPEIKDFYVLSGPNQSTSTSIQIINGKRTQSVTITYSYYLQATSAGIFNIDPARIKVKGEEYTSNSVTVEVITGSKPVRPQQPPATTDQQQAEITGDEEIFIRIVTDKKNVFQGEHIIATIKLYTRLPISGFGNNEMPDFNGFWTQDIETPTQITLQRENLGGRIYNTGIIRKQILFPQRSGEITIEPVKLETYIRQRVNRPSSIFDDFFGSSYQNVLKLLVSDPVKIAVKPLPENKPESFTGAVGSIRLNTEIDKTEAKTNDAISLKIKISGNGNIKLIDNPKINFPPDFETYDPKVTTNINNSENGQSGTKIFEYLIIPRHAGNYRIPPISFAYFDLRTNQYKTLSSNEFMINVSKGDEEEEVSVISGLSKEEYQRLGSDILFIKTHPFKVYPVGKSLFGSYPFYLSYIISLLLFIMLIVLRRTHIKRTQNIELVRNRRANKMARKRLRQAHTYIKENKKEKFYEAVLRALMGYISDKFNIPLSELSRDASRQTLMDTGIEEQIIEPFISIVDICELARYAPVSKEEKIEEVYSHAVKALSNIEQNIK